MHMSGTSGCFLHLCLWFSWPASQGASSCFLYVSMSPLSLKGSAKCRWYRYWWPTSQVHVILQKKHKLQNQFDCHKCQFSRLLDLDLSSQRSDNSEAEEIEVFVLLPLPPIAFQPPKKHNTLISFSLKTCMGHKLRWCCKNSSTISKNKIWRLVQEGAPLCHLCDELVPKVLPTETLA